MKLAIFGVTGRTGRYLLEQALTAGYQVSALVRNPANLTLQHPRLTVVQGVVENAAQVEATLVGAEAVISVLAPASGAPALSISQGTQNIVAAMTKHGIRRLVVSAGAGVSDPNDAPRLLNHLIQIALMLMARKVYEDMKRVVAIVRDSQLDWTVVRVPMLTDDAKRGRVRVGYVGVGVGTRLTRADMADFMLKQVVDRQYVHRAPAISN